MDKPDLREPDPEKPASDRPVPDKPPAIDRTRRLITEMRQVIEAARLSVLAARDLLKQLPGPDEGGTADVPVRQPDDTAENLTVRLVDSLLEAHALANLDEDGETQVLLETALLRVGQRLARRAGPRAAGLVLQ